MRPPPPTHPPSKPRPMPATPPPRPWRTPTRPKAASPTRPCKAPTRENLRFRPRASRSTTMAHHPARRDDRQFRPRRPVFGGRGQRASLGVFARHPVLRVSGRRDRPVALSPILLEHMELTRLRRARRPARSRRTARRGTRGQPALARSGDRAAATLRTDEARHRARGRALLRSAAA